MMFTRKIWLLAAVAALSPGAEGLGDRADAAVAAARSPAPAGARFTPDMTWDSIETLPKLDGVTWASTRAWDMQVVSVARITLSPPLRPEWQAKADSFVERAKQGKAEFKAGACYPNGVPRSAWYAYPPSFIYKPGNNILLTVMGETREIWMDGRPHPARFDHSDPATAYLGHSVGWWEGDTLVIDTIGFSPEHELYYDVPHGNMHVVERYRRLDEHRLALDLTITDPTRLAKPWSVSRIYYTLDQPDTVIFASTANRIDTMPCRPGDSRESIDAEGNSFVDLTPPPPGLGLAKPDGSKQ